MAQTFFPITPVEVTPETKRAWVDTDLSPYIPSGGTGAVFHVINLGASGYGFGIRKHGSSDDRTNTLSHDLHTWAMMGIDINGHVDIYVSGFYHRVWLVGYTMSGVTFLTNGIDKSPGVGGWQDMDCFAEAPGAKALIFEIVGPSSAFPAGIRCKGSTDDRGFLGKTAGHNGFGAIIKCDANQVCQGLRGHSDIRYWLVGYVTDGVTMYTNAQNYSLDTTGIWAPLNALPPGAVMGFFEVYASVYENLFGLRKNGSLEEVYLYTHDRPFAFVECDINQVIEGKIEDLRDDFFLVGYAEGEGVPPVTYTLTIEVIGQGITDPTPGVWEVEEGTEVMVTAIPASGWQFDHWGGDISAAENPVTLLMDRNLYIVAVFTETPVLQHTVSISVVGEGTTDPAPGTYAVDEGTTLTITAYPIEGWLFDHWSGDISGTANPKSVEVVSDLSIIAVFTLIPTRSLNIQVVGEGTTDPAPGTYEYEDGSTVTVSAIPSAGWRFSHWAGDLTGTDNPVAFTITADMNITAVFEEVIPPPQQYAVSISVIGQGTTIPAPGAYTVDEGAILSITAYPAEGWLFDRWAGDISSVANPVDVEVLADISIVAVFIEKPAPVTHTLSISVTGQGTTDPAPGVWEYEEGTEVTVTAYPAAGWAFDHWSGDITSTANPVNISLLTDMSIVAVFVESPVPPIPSWVWPLGAGIVGAVILVAIGRRT